MLIENIRAIAEYDIMMAAIKLHIYEKEENGKIRLLTDNGFREIDPMAYNPGADSIEISQRAAQELMDSLWQCGLRPSQGKGSAGALKAAEDHLESLKKVIDRLFGVIEKKEDN